MTISINNTLGQVVQTLPVSGTITLTNVSFLPAGIYHLTVSKNKTVVFTEKFLKISE